MFAIAVIGIFALYALVSLIVIAVTARYAQKRGRRGWLWGLGAAFVMYNLVFWDYLPTVYMHKHYCEKEAGFWVNKTLDQWKVENPGVMETLVANKGEPSSRQGDMASYVDTYFVNQRINWVVKQSSDVPLLPIIRREQEAVDTKDGNILARQVDFGSYDRAWGGLKFWTSIQHCSGGRDYINNFGKFANQFKGAEK